MEQPSITQLLLANFSFMSLNQAIQVMQTKVKSRGQKNRTTYLPLNISRETLAKVESGKRASAEKKGAGFCILANIISKCNKAFTFLLINQQNLRETLIMGSSSFCQESPVYQSQLQRQLAACLSPQAKLLIKRYGFFSQNNEKIKSLPNCDQIHLKKYYFIGGMKRGLFNGPGILLTAEGLFYQGDFYDGKFQGKGRLITPKGSMYIGQFQTGLFSNEGIYQTVGGVVIQSFWKEGKPEGAGRQIYPDGLQFRGVYQQGQKVNLGKLKWKKDRYFEGSFFLGKVTGKGHYKDTDFSYEGDWQDSWIHGQGLACQKINCYKGDLSYNRKQGRGQLQIQGAVISGQWQDDKLERGFLQLL